MKKLYRNLLCASAMGASLGSVQAGNSLVEHLEKSSPQASSQASAAAADDLATLGKKSANPISDLWLIWSQYDSTALNGDLLNEQEWSNSYKFQPVMTFPLMDGDWNLIVRPVIQYNSVPLKKEAGKLLNASQEQIFNSGSLTALAQDPFGETNGFGDTALLTLAGPNKLDGNIMGVGISQIFPTASEDVLGQGKYQAGPAFLWAHIAPEPGLGFESFNYGLLGQHWWSYAGDDDRGHTNQTDIQYFLNYRLTDTKMIGMTPNIRANWKESGGDRFSVPIGLGYSDVIMMGKLPVRVLAEAQYYVHQPDNAGADWNFRIIFAPIIPRLFGD